MVPAARGGDDMRAHMVRELNGETTHAAGTALDQDGFPLL